MGNKRFGISNVKARKKCTHWQCNKAATFFVGDIAQPHVPTNFYLCEEHGEELARLLIQKYPEIVKEEIGDIFRYEPPETETKTSVDATMQFIKIYYDNNGRISKNEIMEFCQKNGIVLPEKYEELKIKELLEIAFPILSTEMITEEVAEAATAEQGTTEENSVVEEAPEEVKGDVNTNV